MDWQTIFNEKYRKQYQALNSKTTKPIVEFLTDVLPKGSVLDIGCGDGRITEALSFKGWCVIGLDYSENQLEVAVKRKQGIYIKGDMRSLPFTKTFDSAISIFTSFGYFDDAEDDLRTAQSAYHALKTNGLYILDYTPAKSSTEFHTVQHGDFKGKFRNYTEEQMRELLQNAGFRVDFVYGSYKKTPLSEASPRMIFVCTKPV